MCAGWKRWLMLLPILGAFTGCLNSQKNLKPPKIPDEYVLPPSRDARFDAYPTYPARVMGESRIKAEQQAQIDQTPGAPKAGGGH